MSVVLPYNELHTQLTPEQNKAALEKVAAIIKNNQIRSIGDQMKLVLKCSHCCHFEEVQDGEKMRLHEINCSFNPANRKCFSCKYSESDGYGGRDCNAGCDTVVGEYRGNCSGWEIEP